MGPLHAMAQDGAQAINDICFNSSSLTFLMTVATTLTGTISTLFGLLMLSYRGRIKTAEARELDAYRDRDRAAKERNEALWRLQDTRQRYRSFVEQQEPEALPEGRRYDGDERESRRNW